MGEFEQFSIGYSFDQISYTFCLSFVHAIFFGKISVVDSKLNFDYIFVPVTAKLIEIHCNAIFSLRSFQP